MAKRKVLGRTRDGRIITENTPKQQAKIRKELSGDSRKNRNNKKRSSKN